MQNLRELVETGFKAFARGCADEAKKRGVSNDVGITNESFQKANGIFERVGPDILNEALSQGLGLDEFLGRMRKAGADAVPEIFGV